MMSCNLNCYIFFYWQIIFFFESPILGIFNFGIFVESGYSSLKENLGGGSNSSFDSITDSNKFKLEKPKKDLKTTFFRVSTLCNSGLYFTERKL